MSLLFHKLQDIPSGEAMSANYSRPEFEAEDMENPVGIPVTSDKRDFVKSTIEGGADIYHGAFPRGLTVIEPPAKTVRTKGANDGTLRWYAQAADYDASN